MTIRLPDEFYLGLGKVVAAASELEGELAYLCAQLRAPRRETDGPFNAAVNLDHWRAALQRRPVDAVRREASRAEPSLPVDIEAACDAATDLLAVRDRYVHSLAAQRLADEPFEEPALELSTRSPISTATSRAQTNSTSSQ